MLFDIAPEELPRRLVKALAGRACRSVGSASTRHDNNTWSDLLCIMVAALVGENQKKVVGRYHCKKTSKATTMGADENSRVVGRTANKTTIIMSSLFIRFFAKLLPAVVPEGYYFRCFHSYFYTPYTCCFIRWAGRVIVRLPTIMLL